MSSLISGKFGNIEKFVDEREKLAKQYAVPVVTQYRILNTLEQILDESDVVVEETLLVESRAASIQYSLRIVELCNIDTLLATLREVELLKVLGLHKYVMSLFTVFRHRQYVGMIFPAFTCIRDTLDICYRMKKADLNDETFLFYESRLPKWSKTLSAYRKEKLSKYPGILDRDSVVYILKEILKGYIHTQICATNIFINNEANVKLGGFSHARKIGSKKWKFTGNANFFPPEAFLKETDLKTEMTIDPSFDVWSIGMFVIELITGLRTRHSYQKMRKIAMQFIDHSRNPPTLGEVDSSTVIDGKQIYDLDVDSFLESCLQENSLQRATLKALQEHLFITRDINLSSSKLNLKSVPLYFGEFDAKRKLFTEMLSVHSTSTHLKSEFLLKAVHAINLAEKEFYPIVDKVSDRRLIKDYVAVEAVLAMQQEDNDWSRDVLDISEPVFDDDDADDEELKKRRKSRTPGKPSRQPLSGDRYREDTFTGVQMDSYQRVEMIFFVKKDWDDESRHLFMHLQFARWFRRGILSFGDVIRVVDEIEEILSQFVCSKSLSATCPNSISFISGLRKNLVNAKSTRDADLQKYNQVQVKVALKPEVMKEMKEKFGNLSDGDPVELPPKKTTLQMSATYCSLDTKHIDLLENIMFGQRRVDEWKFSVEQRLDDMLDEHTQIRYLLEERRRNPVLKFQRTTSNAEANNEARIAKIWGDYDRDFIFRFCKFNVPYKIEEKDARTLYGSPKSWLKFRETLNVLPFANDLDKQLMRTLSRHDEDFIYPFKYHDEIEARRAAIAHLNRLSETNKERITCLEALLQQVQLFDSLLEPSILSPAPDIKQKLKRFPVIKKAKKI